MSTVLNRDGYRFFFFSNEGSEPPHIHVEHGDGIAKFWLTPAVKLQSTKGMKKKVLAKAEDTIMKEQVLMLGKWNERKKTAS